MARMGRFVVPDPRDNVTANRGCVSLTGTAAARRAAFHDGHVPPVARSLSSVPSASGVVTGKLQVWPWQSIAAGSAGRGRPSRGEPFGQRQRSSRSTVSDGSGARSATAASA